MNPATKSFILKAQDSLDTAKRYLEDSGQHEVVGYNLAQASEFYLKALCTLRGLEFPHDETGHDLDVLMQILEENNFAAISSHADVIELTPYNSPRAFIRDDEKLDLNEYYAHVEHLKKLVGDHAM